MSNKKRALVTGATGFLGSELVKHLLLHGYEVRALRRKTSDCTALRRVVSEAESELKELQQNASVKVAENASPNPSSAVNTHSLPKCIEVIGDITDKASLAQAMQGVDFVFHIAAMFREAKYEDHVYFDVNVEGTRNVLDSAIKAGVKRVIHCSTGGVHSHIPNPPADETEPYRPADVYQDSKLEGELLALEYFRSGKIHGTVIRPAMIWGPGDKRTLKVFRGIKRKKLPLIGTGKTLCHWVMASDLAEGFRLAAEKDIPSGEVFILAGERALTMQELFNEVADAVHVDRPGFRIPAKPVQILGTCVELVCKPFGIEPPIYRRRVDFFTKNRSFDCQKAKRMLGYKPERSFTEEVRCIADWYEAEGWL